MRWPRGGARRTALHYYTTLHCTTHYTATLPYTVPYATLPQYNTTPRDDLDDLAGQVQRVHLVVWWHGGVVAWSSSRLAQCSGGVQWQCIVQQCGALVKCNCSVVQQCSAQEWCISSAVHWSAKVVQCNSVVQWWSAKAVQCSGEVQ